MVSRITEIQTNDGEITLGELIRFLLSTPEFQTKKMTDVLLSLTEHTHNISDLENSANLVREPELKAALDEFDKAVVEALNSLESRIDVPFLRAQLKALQDKPDFDPSRLEKRLKALESQKPEHKTTVIQNFDKSRIDKIEKKQSEVVTLLGKIIDDSNLKVEDLRKEIAAEIGKKIQKEDKHVNIIGGVGGVNKLKLLFDVNIDGITNGQTIAWNSTTEKFEPTSGGGGGSSWGSITGTLSDQTDLQAALDAKVTANASITGATKTKITYDAKGLVTAGADATTADIADSTNKRYVTDAQLTVIGNTSGTNTGDQSLFSTIAVSGQSNVVADSTADTLTLVAGSGVTITTDAATDSITIAASGGGAAPVGAEYVTLSNNGSLTHERVLTAGTGISITDGGAGSTVTVASTITQYTDEMAQDAVGGILVDSSEIDFTYNDATPSITASIVAGSIDETKLDTSVNASLDLADSATQPGDNVSTLTNDAGYITATLSQEQVEDYVGAMVSGNTETLISVTYDDINGKLDFVVDNDLANYSNATSAFITSAGAPVQSVNSQTGTVVLDADDIDDTSTTNKFTTASDISKLAGIEAGADVTDTANVTAAGALMDSEVTNLAAVKAFDPTDYATAAQGTLADSALQSGDNVSALTNDAGYLTSNTAVTVAQGGTGRTTSTTAYGLIAAGTTATGAHQTLPAGATTEILVGGGASALPAWTTATGTGAPVRAGTPSFTTTIGVGAATAAASGAGITFPATQSASTNANTLDDYEEGTWTPTIIGTTTPGANTYSQQHGRYVKIGKMVYCFVYVQLTAKDGAMAGSFAQVSGLPFTSATQTSARWGGFMNDWGQFSANQIAVGLQIQSNAAVAYITLSPAAASAQALASVANITSNTYLGGTFCYEAST